MHTDMLFTGLAFTFSEFDHYPVTVPSFNIEKRT